MRFAVTTFLFAFILTAHGQDAASDSWHEGVAKPFRTVILSASLREMITSITVEEGDRVTEGQVLVSLEAEKEKVAVERLQLMLEKAQFDAAAAKRLYEQNVSSKDEMMVKEVEMKRINSELKIAQAEVAEREIRSPLTGVVVRRFHEPGEAVNEAEPMLQVMDADRLLLLFHLEATQLPSIHLGQELAVRFPEMPAGKVGKAKVNFIDPEVDSRSGLFRVRLLLENQEGLFRPGLRVEAVFPKAPPANKPSGN
ncbi:efflux RND transporter periplasmic adaptor subunit [Prosthecobacter sp.]|uniref:efflux RND transporter periplasmic adaptor subunit n=1 Tax=Prosthecobacter sp. TaxID=1965333 RepID=UPI002489770B|nr:efflux RND transporter periplasmic adaptor subunit [Prosthecobacter sp.]MDI1314241.1 efflux RND transporter periplasmic adaptor subunit [Prosthecobacter sp.]